MFYATSIRQKKKRSWCNKMTTLKNAWGWKCLIFLSPMHTFAFQCNKKVRLFFDWDKSFKSGSLNFGAMNFAYKSRFENDTCSKKNRSRQNYCFASVVRFVAIAFWTKDDTGTLIVYGWPDYNRKIVHCTKSRKGKKSWRICKFNQMLHFVKK